MAEDFRNELLRGIGRATKLRGLVLHSHDGRSRSVAGGVATPGLFQAFGAQPVAGRVFAERDLEAGSQLVAVVSHAFWRTELGESAAALDRSLPLDGVEHRVVGVLPRDFVIPGLEAVEVWIPLWPERLSSRGWRGFTAFGRLASGVSLDQARAELESIRAALEETHPDENAGSALVVDSLHDRVVGAARPALLLFLVAVVAVMLIACANVANLLLVRSAGREREYAVRLTLGAGRLRLAWHVMAECLVLAVVGCGLGYGLAVWTVEVFTSLAPRWLPRVQEVEISPSVLGFAVAVPVAASVVFGVLPGVQAGSHDLTGTLRQGRGGGMTSRRSRVRNALVVAEVALACLLLVVAGLLTRSFAVLTTWQPGFAPDDVVMMSLFASPGDHPEGGQVAELFREAATRARTVPGVVGAGLGSAVPLLGGDGDQEYLVAGEPEPAPGERHTVFWYDTGPGYFRTLGVPLIRGRFFDEGDRHGAPLVAIVNQTMARRHWPDGEPIGQRLHMVSHGLTFEIVGVVGDVRPFRPDAPVQPAVFWPIAQVPRWAVMLVTRVEPSVPGVEQAIRDRLARLDPDLSVSRMVTMEERVEVQLASPRFNMALLGAFALLAATIAAVGMYSVMSYTVVQQTHEIGVRMALGADRSEVLRRVVGRGVALGACGLGLGTLAALAAGRLVEGLLVGVQPSDLATLAGIALLTLTIALLASYLPARRAANLDPMTTLRCE